MDSMLYVLSIRWSSDVKLWMTWDVKIRRTACTVWFLLLNIGMETLYKKIDPQKGEEHGRETDYCHICRSPPPPSNGESIVDQNGVDNPRNERPCFFRIPAPDGPPCEFCPDWAGDDTGSEKGKTVWYTSVVDFIECLKGRKPFRYSQFLLSFDLPFNNEIQERHKESDKKHQHSFPLGSKSRG